MINGDLNADTYMHLHYGGNVGHCFRLVDSHESDPVHSMNG